MELQEFAPRMFELHAQGEYEAARALVIDAEPTVSTADRQTVAFYRICLDARTGRTDTALEILESSLDRGWWFGREMLADDDLNAIREDPRFQAVATRSEELQATASREPCEPIVSDPIGDVQATIVALPAAGGRTTHTSRMWAPAVDMGYRVIAVESSQKVTADRATWDDLDRSIADVTAQLGDATGRIILAGRSLGAAVAFHLATAAIIPTAGLLLVAPTLRWDLIAPQQPIPTVVLAGEDDGERLKMAAQNAADHLRQAGSPVNHQVVSGMGHLYPDNFEALLTDALEWMDTQFAG